MKWILLLFIIIIVYLLYKGKSKDISSNDINNKIPTSNKSNNKSINQNIKYNIEFENILSIDSLNFTGYCSKSKNKRLTIAWSNSDGEGRVLVIDNKKLQIDIRMENPSDGLISNEGIFVIIDASSTFKVFDRNGDIIIDKNFPINIYNCGISDDGMYSVCQLANGESTDSGCLLFYHNGTGSVLWSKSPDSGWAQSYEFNTEKRIFYLVYEDLGKFKYDFSGNFIDFDNWVKSIISHDKGYLLRIYAQDKYESLKQQDILNDKTDYLISLFKKVLEVNAGDELGNSFIHRYLGEIYDELRDFKKAINHYEIAVSKNPNVGIKKRLNSLKKQNL